MKQDIDWQEYVRGVIINDYHTHDWVCNVDRRCFNIRLPSSLHYNCSHDWNTSIHNHKQI